MNMCSSIRFAPSVLTQASRVAMILSGVLGVASSAAAQTVPPAQPAASNAAAQTATDRKSVV